MKKALFLALCLVFLIVACATPQAPVEESGPATEPAPTPSTSVEPEAAPEPIHEYTPPEAAPEPDPSTLDDYQAVARPAEAETTEPEPSTDYNPLEHNGEVPLTSTQEVDQEEFNAQTMLEGKFSGPENYPASGMVKVIERDGKEILLLRDLETLDGPDLHVYLATDNTASDFIDLYLLRKQDKGLDVELELDSSTDLEKYNKVLIYCESFSKLFGEATLS